MHFFELNYLVGGGGAVEEFPIRFFSLLFFSLYRQNLAGWNCVRALRLAGPVPRNFCSFGRLVG
jgi:hypothetical protein